ncbi:substrate-binding domain-containing protein [Maribacter litoralis]|uniref:ABC-type nitrate/sulfonate/bicarbonate transport system, substrate-binding protein n=1 Tax=Maribacter litoralis TaxID=2059726 RepID=A0A653XGW2_9FLAO|nr:substrate-binding domain-containing protein [Maribacter litoralis]VXC29323.1 ABC-type nitrate/sulfonate/bicarbonate transport system, substrate-binding protein [Maribacter litoralis]
MKTVRIIGVPEHFNLPWHLAIEEGAFEERGIQLKWTDIPEGTGKMSQMLKDGETDLAIILTEGIIKSITEGNPVKIIQEYIASPLLWGIHVDAKSSFSSLNELKDTTAAISRFGSGSHLMAYVQAKQMGWDTNTLKFNIINNLNGAIEGLASGEADYFMWERFTTKPLVDNGTFKHLGNCPTPWPCFVLVGTDSFIKENNGILNHILDVINTYTAEFKQIPKIDTTLANRYHQKLEDIQEWLQITEWSQKQLPEEVLRNVQKTLRELNLIEDSIPVTDILK